MSKEILYVPEESLGIVFPKDKDYKPPFVCIPFLFSCRPTGATWFKFLVYCVQFAFLPVALVFDVIISIIYLLFIMLKNSIIDIFKEAAKVVLNSFVGKILTGLVILFFINLLITGEWRIILEKLTNWFIH